MISRIKNQIHKLRWQMFFVLLISGTVSLCLFGTLWHERNYAYAHLSDVPFLQFPSPGDTFLKELDGAAALYEIPDSEKDTERIEKLQSFFSLADEYTSIYIYGTIDGLFRAGRSASCLDTPHFRSFFDVGYSLTDASGEEHHAITMKFKNGYADVLVYFYHSSLFVYPYFYFCIIFCILLFLTAVLSFVSRKMRRISLLKEEILRTPLTILNGYLEILKLGRAPVSSDEYLDRCLKKTTEIREMTDRMFEYALVYEKTETANLLALPAVFWQQCLTEHEDYLRLAGFAVELTLPDLLPQSVPGDEVMIRRVFSNLFSNVLKYGDKKMPVKITGLIEQERFIITLSNSVRQEYAKTESTHIGLKSVQKMMTLMRGAFEIQSGGERFEVMLALPLCLTSSYHPAAPQLN